MTRVLSTRGGNDVGRVVSILVVAMVFAAAIGAITALSSRVLLAPVVAAGGAVMLFVVPARLLLWALLVLSVFVIGPALYYFNIELMRWVPPLISAALFLPFALASVSGRLPVGRAVPQSWLIRIYVLFLLVLAFSTVLSEPRLAEIIFASRMYLAYLPLTLVLAAGMIVPQEQLRIWMFLLWATVAQAPVSVYQALVVAPNREFQTATWDAVVGTFPGNPEIGGANAGMSIFCLIMTLVALSLRKRGLLSGPFFWLVLLSTVVTLGVGEVKAVVLMVPVALFFFYFSEMRRRPVRSVALIASGVVVSVLFINLYNSLYYDSRADSWTRNAGPASAQESIANQFDPRLQQRGAIMGRAAAFYDWGRRNLNSENAVYALAGYGAGAVQIGRIGLGEVAQRLTYRADDTATGLLLWESGLIGHGILALALLIGAVTAFRLAKSPQVPPTHQAIVYALAVGFILHLICLPYKDFMFRAAPSQVFLFLMMGYTAYWSRVERGSPLPVRRWKRR